MMKRTLLFMTMLTISQISFAGKGNGCPKKEDFTGHWICWRDTPNELLFSIQHDPTADGQGGGVQRYTWVYLSPPGQIPSNFTDFTPEDPTTGHHYTNPFGYNLTSFCRDEHLMWAEGWTNDINDADTSWFATPGGDFIQIWNISDPQNPILDLECERY